MNLDLLELIRSRRSIRSYHTERTLSEEQIEALLEAARWAPSGGNVQPWRFYVVRDATLRADLARAALNQDFVARAPVVIAVCVDLDAAERSYGSRGRDLYCLQDTAAAVQNMLLLAHAMELGTCWVGAVPYHCSGNACRIHHPQDRFFPHPETGTEQPFFRCALRRP